MGLKITECPRDAMQGIPGFIPTQDKVAYLNQLLKVGFDTLDFGSFVSPSAIPQMADTKEIVPQLDLSDTNTKLLAIVANERGAQDALDFDEIDYLGFPLSASETFQLRNTNKTIGQALNLIQRIQEDVDKKNKTLVVYISMAFGNPYGDPYEPGIVSGLVNTLEESGIQIISASDTIGNSTRESVFSLLRTLKSEHPNIELGAHLHSTPETVYEKIGGALDAKVDRIDGALQGYGGCPMAEDELTGNLPTEQIVTAAEEHGIGLSIDHDALYFAMQMASQVFPK